MIRELIARSAEKPQDLVVQEGGQSEFEASIAALIPHRTVRKPGMTAAEYAAIQDKVHRPLANAITETDSCRTPETDRLDELKIELKKLRTRLRIVESALRSKSMGITVQKGHSPHPGSRQLTVDEEVGFEEEQLALSAKITELETLIADLETQCEPILEARVRLSESTFQRVKQMRDAFSSEVKKLAFGDGIRRVIEWVNLMENTPNGIVILRNNHLGDVFDLENATIVMGLMLRNSQKGLAHERRNEVIEWMVGEEGNLSEEGVKRLLDHAQRVELGNEEIDNPQLVQVLSLQLLTATLIPRETVTHRDSQGEPKTSRIIRGTTITGLKPNLTITEIEGILESGDSFETDPEFLFNGISEETLIVLKAMNFVDHEVYTHLIKLMVLTCLTSEVRFKDGTPQFNRWNTGARALQLLVRILVKDEMETPANIRDGVETAIERSLATAMPVSHQLEKPGRDVEPKETVEDRDLARELWVELTSLSNQRPEVDDNEGISF
jgi:hypothetical protein